jgi:hypothetical protein
LREKGKKKKEKKKESDVLFVRETIKIKINFKKKNPFVNNVMPQAF